MTNLIFDMIDHGRAAAAAESTHDKIRRLEAAANELAASEVWVESNAGTYSGADALRAGCGSMAPEHSEYRVTARVRDGHRQYYGPPKNRAPGTVKYYPERLIEAQRRLAALRAEIEVLHRIAAAAS